MMRSHRRAEWLHIYGFFESKFCGRVCKDLVRDGVLKFAMIGAKQKKVRVTAL